MADNGLIKKNETSNYHTVDHTRYRHIVMLSLEVLTTVFSLIVLIWQFALAINVKKESLSMQSTKSYKFLTEHLINFEMVDDIEVFNTSERKNCSIDFDPYHFLDIEGINNTCVESINGTSILRFEKGCDNSFQLPQPNIISNIFDIMMCYKIHPKKMYVYSFQELKNSCKENQINCGITDKYIICLETNEIVKKCPIIELWFYSKDELNNEYKLLSDNKISYFKEIDKYLVKLNYTTSKFKFLSFNLKYKTFNDIPYYTYFEKYGYYYEKDSEKVFSSYFQKYNPINSFIEFNPYYTGKISDLVTTNFVLKSKEFFKWYNITNSSKIIIFNNTFDPQLEMQLMSSFFSIPNDKCIQDLFINKPINNDRGLFVVLSDFSFEYLNLNLIYFITWTFIQAGTFYIYSFMYRIGILSDSINNVLREIDKSSEHVTVITLKAFYYISLCMKLLILYNINNDIRRNIEFLEYLKENKCFAVYHQLDTFPDDSLVHLNIRQFLKEQSLLKLAKKGLLIYNITFVEIFNDVVSLIFYGIKIFYKF